MEFPACRFQLPGSPPKLIIDNVDKTVIRVIPSSSVGSSMGLINPGSLVRAQPRKHATLVCKYRLKYISEHLHTKGWNFLYPVEGNKKIKNKDLDFYLNRVYIKGRKLKN